MHYVCTLIAVRDLEQSKAFYRDVLGQTVVQDLGANVTLSGGFALQSLASWQAFIETGGEDIVFGCNNAELVFETDDLDTFLEKLTSLDVAYVHPAKAHVWGQRVVRIYDPDRHMIVVGESMSIVVRRFLAEGLTVAQTAARMGMPADAVRYLLAPETT